MKLYVGIDVSSRDLATCIMDHEGNTCARFKVDNHLLGATFLRDQILLWANKRKPTEILIGMEATSVYSWHPAMFFHQQEALQAWNVKVFTINPKLIRKFKEAYVDLEKTDDIDAWIIADRLRFGRLKMTAVLKEQFLALQRLTRMRYHLVHQLTREKQYFLQHLFYKCSSFTQEVDSSIFGHAILELLLESWSLDDICQMDVKQLADFLRQKGRNRFADPECI
ncbi:transposase, partial [Aeribacillus composti]